MRIAVVGAGPAGVTTGRLLRDQGHTVTVYEKLSKAGGRTASIHFGPEHWVDTGAGWFASFYSATWTLFKSSGFVAPLRKMTVLGGGDLVLDGEKFPAPNSVRRMISSKLLGPFDKIRFIFWAAKLFATQRGGLRIDRNFDHVPAMDTLRPMGKAALERAIRPTFEGPFFARLEEMNGTLVRSWLRALPFAKFFQMDGGMDFAWQQISGVLATHFDSPVTAVGSASAGGAWLQCDGDTSPHVYDAIVLAVPAGEAARLLGEAAPAALNSVEYAPHVRVYIARPVEHPVTRIGSHIFPNATVATVERGNGGQQSWGSVPEGWEWVLVCAPAASSERLLDMDDDTLLDLMFSTAGDLVGEKFQWRDYTVQHVVRWRRAVPVVGPHFYRNVDSLNSKPPIVFAGDWLDQPCVEGAVRSGFRAAQALDPRVRVPRHAR